MAVLTNTKTITYSIDPNDPALNAMNFEVIGGEYTITDPASKFTQVQLQGGQTTNILDGTFSSSSIFNFGETGAKLNTAASLIGETDTTERRPDYLNITGA